jgi:hypothetical protein
VIVKVTDNCPAGTNQQWCSGDITHFDLSQAAFEKIASASAGVIKMQYRRTSCLYTTPIRISQENPNQWYMKLRVLDVANYGSISKVAIASKGPTAYTAMTHTSDGAWELSVGGNGYVLPLSLQITDSNGQVLTLSNVITSLGNGVTSTSTANYKNTAAAETTTVEPSPFMKVGVYVLVVGLIVVILLVGIALLLRSKARERGTSVSDYVRGSVGVKHQELGMAPVPISPMSSSSDLVPVTSSPQAEEHAELTATTDPSEPAAPAVSPQEWEQKTDPTSGQPFYYNNSTGVTQWEVPEGFQTA